MNFSWFSRQFQTRVTKLYLVMGYFNDTCQSSNAQKYVFLFSSFQILIPSGVLIAPRTPWIQVYCNLSTSNTCWSLSNSSIILNFHDFFWNFVGLTSFQPIKTPTTTRPTWSARGYFNFSAFRKNWVFDWPRNGKPRKRQKTSVSKYGKPTAHFSLQPQVKYSLGKRIWTPFDPGISSILSDH